MMMQRELTHYDDARWVLAALLRQKDDPDVIDISDLSDTDRLFLISTCCAVVLEHTLCLIARHHNKHATEGLEALYQHMRINIETRCKAVQ